MNKNYFWVILLLHFVVDASYDAIINLGGDCQVSHQLAIHGLRKYALPFDGLVTSVNSLLSILTDNFEGFLVPDNFEFICTEKGEKYILDKKYRTTLMHDFPLQADFLRDFDAIAVKYQRRIDRLRELIIESENPLFIRKRINPEQAMHLKDLLSTLRQGKPFLLLALDGNDQAQDDWGIESVKNYQLRQPVPYSWTGDKEAWLEIFKNLDLPIADFSVSTVEH